MNETPRRPRVTLKIAQTLDGRVATASGHSRWVSSAGSRAIGHTLRAAHDAILVGIGTVLADDPRLDVRLATGANPIRVVVDSTLRIPLDAAVLTRDGTQVVVVTAASVDSARADAVRSAGARVISTPADDGRVDLAVALQALTAEGIQSLLIEGGAEIATEVLRRRLVDDLVVFIAPKILGSGISAVGDLGATDMSSAIVLSDRSVEMLDGDIVYRGKPVWPHD